ncbi:MAG: cyclic nucleotide-binding protein [Candidatus Magnetoglobus multicellularis str. Araruama]|uniref:Cyclic nucleotide-binding protein n=1 Tax=Candidatus Magnetoglobus multicellularis str. Araruama TaxID=890399 RepID=A0A1V1P134_9BACT|nr:MAG: cyclic nucleotide-binding protein [Candidatus Magnetoglobus multicellularis str. Araruama]
MKTSNYGLRRFICGIWKIILPFKKYLFWIFIGIITGLSYTIILPLCLQSIIDKGIKNNDINLIIHVISGLGIFFIVYTIAYLFESYMTSILTARSLDNLRWRMMNHVYFLPVSYYQQNNSTSILARFSNDISAIENVIIRALFDFLYHSSSIICCMILLFFVQWRLALVVLLLSPLMIIIPEKISQKATKASYMYKTNQEDLLNRIQEHINGQPIIRLFGLRKFMIDMYESTNQTVIKTGIKSHYLSLLVALATNTGSDFILLLVVALGSILTINGFMTVGAFIAFSAYLFRISGSTSSLSNIFPILYQGIGSMQRIDEFLQNELRPVKHSEQSAFPKFIEKIYLKDVSFSYDGKKPQVKNVNIEIEKGTLTAFIGTSGAGKSTISKLLMGFLFPGKGKILLDNFDIAETSIDLIRSRIGAVLQDTFLFNTSIKENIRYGRLDASDEEIQEAARDAEIHDWIMTLPKTYDTKVGESGSKLSGGQRQRIAIARALVRKPEILILDEAFSALDPATELSVNETIKKLARQMTIIAITHNLASVSDFNQIFVMAEGKILEQGAHQQLLSQKGFYYQLWQKQTGLFFKKDTQEFEITTERLSKIPLLSAIKKKDLEQIKEQLTTESFEQGREILYQGDPGKRFYFIAKGKVEIEKTISDGKVLHLGVKEIGDYFGEVSLIRNCPITASVRAIDNTICLTLSRDHFQRFLDRHPDLEKRINDFAKNYNSGS